MKNFLFDLLIYSVIAFILTAYCFLLWQVASLFSEDLIVQAVIFGFTFFIITGAIQRSLKRYFS